MDGTQTKDRKQAANESGGIEGGMASGSAGGPGQADKAANANESDGGAAGPDTSGSVDLGKGSHEQTQGLTVADKS